MKINPILNGDSYKYSHYKQYPPGTQYVSSYISARGSKDPDAANTLFFGLQAFLREYMITPITAADVEQAQRVIEQHGEPFNYDGWMRIVTEHNGMFPVEITAIPEGTIAPLKTALVQVRNTDPQLPWITSFIETAILRAVWYPTTVATRSWMIRQALKAYSEKSGSVEGVDFKLHDFGARGVSSNESAMIGGVAHLATGAKGTDTVMSLVAAEQYYDTTMAAFSIPAAEHSTITSWGRDNEIAAYQNMLDQFAKPGALVAVVSDSYDIMNAASEIWGGVLKQQVLDSGATVVIRPDSGCPIDTPVEVIERLIEKYGCSVNEAGYRTLPPAIRVIQGDGINKDSINQIIAKLDEKKLALDNIAFGMGGAMLQQLDRDTFSFAMKASSININGTEQDVYKDPVGDNGKASLRGILDTVVQDDGTITTVRAGQGTGKTLMRVVYKDGELYNQTTLADVVAQANK